MRSFINVTQTILNLWRVGETSFLHARIPQIHPVDSLLQMYLDICALLYSMLEGISVCSSLSLRLFALSACLFFYLNANNSISFGAILIKLATHNAYSMPYISQIEIKIGRAHV